MLKKIVKFFSLSLLFLVIFLTLTLSLGLLLAPGIGLKLANSWYSKQGEGYNLAASNWSFNPLSAHLLLQDVKLTHPNQLDGSTYLEEIKLVVEPKQLLNKQLLITEISLEGFGASTQVFLDKDKQEIQLAGLTIPLNSDPKEQEEVKEPEESTGELPIALSLNKLRLANFNFHWQFKDATNKPAMSSSGSLKLNHLELSQLDSATNAAIPMSLSLELSKFSFQEAQKVNLTRPLTLNLEGKLLSLFEQPSWQGKAELNRLGVNLLLNPNAKPNEQEKITLNFNKLAFAGLSYLEDKLNLDKLHLQQLNLATNTNKVSLPSLVINKLAVTPKQQQLAAIELSNLQVEDATTGIQLKLPKFIAKQIKFTPATEVLNLSALNLTDLAVNNSTSKTSSLADIDVKLPKLELNSLEYRLKQETLNLAQFSLANLDIAYDKTTYIKLPVLALNKINFNQKKELLNLAELKLQQLDVHHDKNISLNLPEFELNNLSFDLAAENLELERLGLQKLAVQLEEEQLKINLPRLAAEKARLNLKTTGLQLAELSLTNLGVLQEALELRLGKLHISDTNYLTDKQTIKAIALHNLKVKQQMDARDVELTLTNLNFNNITSLLELQKFSLDSIRLNPRQGASSLVFTDTSVTPRVRSQVKINQLAIDKVAAQVNPDSSLELAPAKFNIHLGLGEFGQLKTQGNIGLINLKGDTYPEGQFTLNAEQLDAVDFNGYLNQALGYQLKHGSLDIDTKMQIKQAALKGEVNLLLRNSRFIPANEETIKKISKQISMPLDMALDLLRDKRGNLNLKLPVSGELNHPNFSWQPLINKITTRALKAGSVYMLKQSLQPYSLFVSLGYMAGEYAFAIRLNALEFDEQTISAQDAQLTNRHIANLEKLGELMKEKDDIEVTACPFASEKEVKALGDKWEDLAYKRGLLVKSWIEDNYPKEARRLTRCKPQKGKKAEVVLGVR